MQPITIFLSTSFFKIFSELTDHEIVDWVRLEIVIQGHGQRIHQSRDQDEPECRDSDSSDGTGGSSQSKQILVRIIFATSQAIHQ